MRTIVVGAFVSLDGVMQAPGGPEEDPTGGFRHGGWVASLWDEGVGASIAESFSAPFDLLLGRRTYDIFAAHWPFVAVDGAESNFDALNADIARRFNGLTKYVATHRPESLTWKNSQALGPDVAARLRQLKAEEGPVLLTQGSSELLQLLFEHDLVDELRLVTFPVLLGKGKKLFGGGTMPAGLKLRKCTTSPRGAVIASYAREGGVTTGSFAMETPTAAELERRRNWT